MDQHEPPGARKAKHSREDRLKLALRENLKRRKSQARGRDSTTTPSGDIDRPPDDNCANGDD